MVLEVRPQLQRRDRLRFTPRHYGFGEPADVVVAGEFPFHPPDVWRTPEQYSDCKEQSGILSKRPRPRKDYLRRLIGRRLLNSGLYLEPVFFPCPDAAGQLMHAVALLRQQERCARGQVTGDAPAIGDNGFVPRQLF